MRVLLDENVDGLLKGALERTKRTDWFRLPPSLQGQLAHEYIDE